MDLKQIQEKSSELSPWAHIATVGSDGFPDVAPVHPAWKDGTIWIGLPHRESGFVADLLRQGASLAEIGQLLRHSQPNTTQIYAKVDIQSLRGIAVAWPAGAP